MNVRIMYFCMYLFFISISLTSCQSEDMYVKNKGNGVKSGLQVKTLKGVEAKKAENLLKSVLGKSGGLYPGVNTLMREGEENIDYNNILLVLDTLGIRNYTYKILNHPDDNYKTFHNLVLTEKDGTLELAVMKYEMTDLFAQDYNTFLKTFNEFEGKIAAIGLDPALDPCEEIIRDYPSASGSNGGGNEPPPVDEPDDPGDPYTGGTESECISISLSFECSCGRSYATFEDYTNSMCGDGSNPGFSLTIVVRAQYLAFCRLPGEPCIPVGSIGVIGPETDCNSFEERIRDILSSEGGFVNDPTDPGGATNKGISWKVWLTNAQTLLNVEPTLNNLQALTDNQAKIIYKALYWDKVKCNDINDGDLRYLLFDFYVNAGGNAVKVLKKTLNSSGYNLVVNSEMDDDTINAINNHPNIVNLYNLFKSDRLQYYNDIANRSVSKYLIKKPNASQQQINAKTLKKYLNGWLNRTNNFLNKTEQNPTNVNC